jgi:hypothetical protein
MKIADMFKDNTAVVPVIAPLNELSDICKARRYT